MDRRGDIREGWGVKIKNELKPYTPQESLKKFLQGSFTVFLNRVTLEREQRLAVAVGGDPSSGCGMRGLALLQNFGREEINFEQFFRIPFFQTQ